MRSSVGDGQGGEVMQFEFPAGFRFHPTDEELVNHYLCRKCATFPISVPIIADIDLYKFDPWQLPGMALYGEKEWYFFSPRDRKYPNGSRPNRSAGSGYWKATGADKPIGKPKTMGIKKALVFYIGKAPNGVKTNWIMHEYRLPIINSTSSSSSSSSSTTTTSIIIKRSNSNHLRLDDWVLCRIYNKKGKQFITTIIDQNSSNHHLNNNENDNENENENDDDHDHVQKKPNIDLTPSHGTTQLFHRHPLLPPPPPQHHHHPYYYYHHHQNEQQQQQQQHFGDITDYYSIESGISSDHVLSPEVTCEAHSLPNNFQLIANNIIQTSSILDLDLDLFNGDVLTMNMNPI